MSYQDIVAWLDSLSSSEAMGRLTLSLLTLVSFLLLRWFVGRILHRQVEDVALRYRAGKAATYTVTVIAGLLIGTIWIDAFRGMGTFLGIITAGLAIALKDLIAGIAGWVYIVLRRPFTVGDRIAIRDHAGDVIDQRLFRFTILEIGNWVEAEQSTGRVIHIPNSLVFTETIANYTAGFAYIWNELSLTFTFESDWRKAKKILQETVDELCSHIAEAAERAIHNAAKSQMIIYSHLTPRVWTRIVDCGVELTIRYLCNPRQRRTTAEEVHEAILDTLAKHDDIDFAYPTVRRYDNRSEGKAGAGRRPEQPAQD